MRKVFGVLLLFLPLVSQAAAPKAPAEKEARALTLNSVLAFNKAVQAKDFVDFHKQISSLWQGQITPDKLKEVFRTFIDQNLDISGVEKVDPTFDVPPKIDSDGVLALQGSYLIAPNKVEFRLKYVNEKAAWKLIGIKLDVKPSGASDVKLPSEEETKALVRDSLLSFNRAVQDQSFAEFHKEISAVWQKQITPEKLQELFQPFIDAEVDLAPIAKREPAFDKPPAIDEDGVLRVQGEYPTQPHGVRFDLGYLFDGLDWRLIKINVKVGEPDEETPDEE